MLAGGGVVHLYGVVLATSAGPGSSAPRFEAMATGALKYHVVAFMGAGHPSAI